MKCSWKKIFVRLQVMFTLWLEQLCTCTCKKACVEYHDFSNITFKIDMAFSYSYIAVKVPDSWWLIVVTFVIGVHTMYMSMFVALLYNSMWKWIYNAFEKAVYLFKIWAYN